MKTLAKQNFLLKAQEVNQRQRRTDGEILPLFYELHRERSEV